jgi:hypothetical protein
LFINRKEIKVFLLRAIHRFKETKQQNAINLVIFFLGIALTLSSADPTAELK